jgi:hypothetical protein
VNEPLARRTLPAADVSAALDGREVRDVEPRLPPGAYGSLFHAYRAIMPPPHRATLVQVFPYLDGDWEPWVREVLTLEVLAWRAWWTWVRAGLGRDPNGVFRIPPLVEAPAEAVREVSIHSGDHRYLALVRPYLEWPDLAKSGLPDDRLTAPWQALRATIAAVGEEVAHSTGRAWQVPEQMQDLPEFRRRLLTDGRHLVVTHWRAFDPRLRLLDAQRTRTAQLMAPRSER